ncbi:hypothetical protein BDD12DRAFT_660917, partial [Trichophaea hybrida]
FLGLLPITNQDEHFSPINPDDPKLYWIFRDEEFIRWKSEHYPQVLWLFGGPPGCRMTDVSSYISNQATGAVFYISCSSVSTTTFAHSVLHHILKISDDCQAKLITNTFFSTLLLKILEQDQSYFRDDDSSIVIVKKILEASDGEHLEALTKAVGKIKEVQETSIIIDGIDELGKEGVQFLQNFCSQAIISPKFKVLVTGRPDPHTKKIVAEVLCIEHKEQQREYDGTLAWLWDHKQYQAWSSSPSSDLLLIEGKPGSGKSTLTKYFKSNLFERQPPAKQAIVASFFYSHRDGELHTNHSNMLRSILYDVLQQNETFFFHFQPLYRKRLQHGAWSYDSLKKILLSFTEHPVKERLYLIIDAVDESDLTDRHDIIRLLHQLCITKKHCIVKVFVASRPIAWLSHRVAEIKTIIKLQDENEPDILKFAKFFLAELKLSTKSHKDTKDYIIQNAQGVFVWVHLVQKELLKYHATGYRDQDIYVFLRSLPKELDDFYKRMLRELEDNDEQRDIKDGVRMFQLVLFAYRPLRVPEIQHALAIPDDINTKYSPSDESFEATLISDIVKRIIHCGGNFLDIKGVDILQFTHQTALKFFSRLLLPAATSKFKMDKDDTRNHISITCIRYLMLCVARSTPENEPPNTESWEPAHFENYAEYLNRRPFISYSLNHFQQHKNDCALRIQQRKNDCSIRYDTLHTATTYLLFQSWIDSYPGRRMATEEQRLTAKHFRNNMLHTATRMQYSWAVEALLTAGADREARLLHKTPLLVSAETGDVATAAALLRIGARTDAKDKKGQTALLRASTKGHDTMFSLLVDGGANKEAKDDKQWTALHHAASNGHDSTVQLLVETLGADKEAKDGTTKTPLHQAASNGHHSTVQLLVETLGADKEAKDNNKWTALHHAASNGHHTTVKLLVETLCADKEAKDN